MRNKSIRSSNTIQTFWVLIGSLSAFAFSIVSSMILSRYFDKADYGTYKQVMYVYGSLLVVFTLGLPKAYSYFLPRVPRNEAKSVIKKINLILIGSGLLMSAMLFIGAEAIASVLNNEDLATPLKYFSLVPLFMLPTMGLEGILATFKKTKFLAYYNVATRVLMLACVTLPVIIFKGDVNFAIVGFTIASFISFILALILKNLPVKNEVSVDTNLNYKEIFAYTIPIMMAAIWGIAIKSADQFFISRYFGQEVFADFANGSLELPFVGMIISAASIVLAPIYSKKAFENSDISKKQIINLWHSVFEKTIKLIYPLIVFFFCFADVIMVVLYGDRYETSGQYFQIKLIVNFFTLIAYGPLVLSVGGNKYYYKVHMYGAIILIGLEYLSVKFISSPIAIVWISVICQIGRIMAMLIFVAKYIEIRIIKLFPLKLMANLLIPAFIILYGLRYLLTEYLELNNLLLIALALIFYMVLFSCWVYFRKIDYYTIIKPIISKLLNR